MSGQHVSVGLRGDVGDDPQQHVLWSTGRHDRLQAVDVIRVVDDHQAEARYWTEQGGMLLAGLGIAVQDEQAGIDAGFHRAEDLAAAGNIETEPLLDHDPLHCRTWKGFRREHDPAARPTGREGLDVLPRPGPQSVLGDDQHRRPELIGELVCPTAADFEHSVLSQHAAAGKQAEQVGHPSVRE